AIGAGGMGDVYRALDTRLDRTVAIKVLPPAFAADADRRQRFEREARLIASLSHPHICALHDIGSTPEAGPNHPANAYLVMEYLDGETLASRIARGPVPLDEALRYARDMALALDAAHRQRIVHRDLKPGNVMLTRAGLKLLDFGLAKAMDPDIESSATAPTVEMAAVTSPGTVLGTVPYMAPEQVQGRATDSRSDIFALGAVIYEMVTGRRAFGGESPAAVASAILSSEPAPIAASPSLERIVRTCLAKDPERRWQSAYDVAVQLSAPDERSAIADDARPSRGSVLPWAIAAVASLIAVIMGMDAWRDRHAATSAQGFAPGGALSFVVPPPPHGSFAPSVESNFLSISPDGSHVAFAVLDRSRAASIWVRPVASHEARAVEGTAGATSAFWSPDGKSIGYFTEGKLKRVSITGGNPVTICDVGESTGQAGTWGAKGEILFASVHGDAIMRVPASGAGGAVEFLKPEPARNERRTVGPSFLPNGRQFLYFAGLADETGAVMLGDLQGPSREVMRIKSYAQYVDPGFIVFAQDSALLARRFDAATGQVSGDPMTIAERVNGFLGTAVREFAASFNGVIVYQSHVDQSRIASFDGQGRETGTVRKEARYQALRVSPDGRRMLFDRADPRTATFDVWLLEMDRDVETRLTSEIGSEIYGIWAPDDTIIYAGTRGGRPPQLFRRSLASGADEPLSPKGFGIQVAPDLAPNGTSLMYAERAERGTFDLLTMSLADRRPVPFRASPADELDGRFSPDGRFVAYTSDESGRQEVYIEPFPAGGSRHIASSEGGQMARWSRDGGGLFYVGADAHLMSVPISLSPLQIGKAVRLFRPTTAWRWLDYDVSGAGQFIASVPTQVAAEQPLTVIVNWPAAVSRTP
ncbi:MAG TPA: protein kinase, partial [Vicinamibacterales bacterium]|nr:protein kinase [Vicinamibacterales bacterium]